MCKEWHFGENLLPLTGGVVILCALVAVKGEERTCVFASTRAWKKANSYGEDEITW